jgi:hypothetical protein
VEDPKGEGGRSENDETAEGPHFCIDLGNQINVITYETFTLARLARSRYISRSGGIWTCSAQADREHAQASCRITCTLRYRSSHLSLIRESLGVCSWPYMHGVQAVTCMYRLRASYAEGLLSEEALASETDVGEYCARRCCRTARRSCDFSVSRLERLDANQLFEAEGSGDVAEEEDASAVGATGDDAIALESVAKADAGAAEAKAADSVEAELFAAEATEAAESSGAEEEVASVALAVVDAIATESLDGYA